MQVEKDCCGFNASRQLSPPQSLWPSRMREMIRRTKVRKMSYVAHQSDGIICYLQREVQIIKHLSLNLN